MNILFVNNQYNLFTKADCGASQRSMCVIHALAQIGHVDVISFVDETISNESNVDVIYSKEIGMSAHKEGRFGKFLKLLSWKSPYTIFPINKEKEQIIDAVVQQGTYDCIFVRYLHFACNCGLLKYADRLFIDYDDDLRDAARMEADRAKSFRNKVYGKIYAHTIHYLSCYVAKRIRHAYYSSPNRALPNSDFLPNISAFQEPLESVDFALTKPVILIVGNFKYHPNEYGLLHFLKNIYPSVRKHVVDVELHVIGSIPDVMYDRIKPYIQNGVRICGYVSDLVAEYKKCRCVAVPLYQGTGTSVKLVEAMSLNRAVVSTSVGVRGLHHSFGPTEDYLLEDDDKQFAYAVERLLLDEKTNRRLSTSALCKIKEHYSAQRFNDIIKKTL